MNTKPPTQENVPSREAAAERAEQADRFFFIVVPGSRWGGKTATLGPFNEAEARTELGRWLPLFVPECPPKLVRVIEDYAS